MRCGGKISRADRVGVRAAAKQIFDAGTIHTRRGAENAIETNCALAVGCPTYGGEWIFVAVFVARGDGLHGGVDKRDLRREQVAEQSGNAPGDVDARTADG